MHPREEHSNSGGAVEEETIVYVLEACGRANRPESVHDIFQAYASTDAPLSLATITRVIYHLGRHKLIDRAMQVYDVMLEKGMKPDRELNKVLIHVCKIDPVSVVLNDAK